MPTAPTNPAINVQESGEKGALQRAKAILEDTHSRRMETIGENHFETLASKYQLASVYIYSGELLKSEKFSIRAWRGMKDQLGEKNPDTLHTEIRLSWAYCERDKNDEAEKLQRRTLDNMVEVLGAIHADTTIAMANLALTLSKIKGKIGEAEELKLKVVDLREIVLGGNHPDRFLARANLAFTYDQQNRWKEAEDL